MFPLSFLLKSSRFFLYPWIFWFSVFYPCSVAKLGRSVLGAWTAPFSFSAILNQMHVYKATKTHKNYLIDVSSELPKCNSEKVLINSKWNFRQISETLTRSDGICPIENFTVDAHAQRTAESQRERRAGPGKLSRICWEGPVATLRYHWTLFQQL